MPVKEQWALQLSKADTLLHTTRHVQTRHCVFGRAAAEFRHKITWQFYRTRSAVSRFAECADTETELCEIRKMTVTVLVCNLVTDIEGGT